MFGIKCDVIDPQFLASLVFSYHQLVGGVQNTATQGKKIFVFLHNTSFFGSCLFNNQNQTFFLRAWQVATKLRSILIWLIGPQRRHWSRTDKSFLILKLNIWLCCIFLACIHETTVLHVPKSTVELRALWVSFVIPSLPDG